jgi:gliding motility-associated-like protein
MFVEGEGFDINFPANQVTAVAGQSISLTAATTAGVAPYTYQWTIDGNTTTNSDSTFSLTVTKTDTLFVEAIDACGDSSQAQIIINVVYPPTADPGSDTTICNGGQVIVGGSDDHTPPPGDTIFWTAQDSSEQGWISNDSIYHPTITIPRGVTGSFTFKFTVIDSTGILEDSVTITSVPNPPLFVTGDSIITCANASIILTASSGFNYYVWSTGSRDTAITVNQPGQYNVTATEGSCSDTSNQVNVTQLTAQGVQVFPDTTIKYGDSVMLTAQPSLDGSGIDSFRWYGQNGLTCDTCFTPFVSPLNSQIYGVRVYSQGCEVTDSVYINVILPINFFIPNVFSPNGDGSDDYFFIMAQPGVTVQSFQVYDRIGEKVHDGQYPWDGNFKGKPEPPGTYVYIFKLSVYGGNAPIEQHGTITLLR